MAEVEQNQMKYCLYARKSTEGDEKQALSIDSQIKEMKQIAERENLNVVEIRKESHSAKESSQRPVFEEIVNPEWIQFYDKFPATGLHSICIGIDLAVSERDSADCTAMLVGYVYGIGKNMKVYLKENPINERISFPVQAEYVKALVATEKLIHHRVKLFVEDVGYQKAFIQLFESKNYDIEGVPTGRNDKATRLRMTTPFLKEGRVLFPKNGCEELIQQLLGFGKEKHDDLADSFSILVLKVIENNPSGGGIIFG